MSGIAGAADSVPGEADADAHSPHHHLFVAGTGRAGTSFLVKYLSGMGLETHIERSGDGAWHPEAQAGLEDIPFGGQTADLPYVVKTPWLSEFIDDVLADRSIVLDAVIIPVRDLTEAASSRVLQELRTLHQAAPWQAAGSRTSETWATTPGGVLFSLNVLDQGRLLAVWLHQLVQRLTRADIPIVFLDFPRFAEDPDYVFAKLRGFLPAGTTVDHARATHGRLADRSKIRVGDELRAAAPGRAHHAVDYPDPDKLDRVALAREITRLNTELTQAKAESAEVRAELTRAAVVQTSLTDALAAARIALAHVPPPETPQVPAPRTGWPALLAGVARRLGARLTR